MILKIILDLISIHDNTVLELIFTRVNAEKDNLSLNSFKEFIQQIVKLKLLKII